MDPHLNASVGTRQVHTTTTVLYALLKLLYVFNFFADFTLTDDDTRNDVIEISFLSSFFCRRDISLEKSRILEAIFLCHVAKGDVDLIDIPE